MNGPYTPPQAAALLGCSREAIYNAIRRGLITIHVNSCGCKMIDAADLSAWDVRRKLPKTGRPRNEA